MMMQMMLMMMLMIIIITTIYNYDMMSINSQLPITRLDLPQTSTAELRNVRA